MEHNDFYEVNGCRDFIPVTINETYADSVAVTVDNYMRGYGLVVKEVYRFPKGHEPQKPVIPKFVAEWIEKEKKKKQKRRLSHALGRVFNDSNELSLYIKQQEGDYTETIAKAWIYGYTVEKEKRYTVEIPNPDSDSLTVLEKFDDGTVVISQMDVFPVDWKNQAEYQLTEAEIRKGFEWAWQFAKEVE